MAVGTYNFNFTVDLSNLKEFFLDLSEQMKGKKGRLSMSLRAIQSRRLEEMAKELNEEPLMEENVFERITDALNIYRRHGNCPNEIRQMLEVSIKTPRGLIIRRRGVLNIFQPLILPHLKDVFWIEKKRTSDNVWFVDVTTIKKDGIDIYKNFISNIPVLKDQIKVNKDRQTFSSRYTFRPFPLAVRLWLREGETELIPQDLKDFLEAAIRYHNEKEWRTSIILSAITVESLLADLYEEKYHEYAPNTPLGDLFQKVQQKTTFPPDVRIAIERTNDARIAAVHRSHFSVSDRDSMNALFGATNFMMWYFSQL